MSPRHGEVPAPTASSSVLVRRAELRDAGDIDALIGEEKTMTERRFGALDLERVMYVAPWARSGPARRRCYRASC